MRHIGGIHNGIQNGMLLQLMRDGIRVDEHSRQVHGMPYSQPLRMSLGSVFLRGGVGNHRKATSFDRLLQFVRDQFPNVVRRPPHSQGVFLLLLQQFLCAGGFCRPSIGRIFVVVLLLLRDRGKGRLPPTRHDLQPFLIGYVRDHDHPDDRLPEQFSLLAGRSDAPLQLLKLLPLKERKGHLKRMLLRHADVVVQNGQFVLFLDQYRVGHARVGHVVNQGRKDHGESQPRVLADPEGNAFGPLSIVEARFGGRAVRRAAAAVGPSRVLGGDASFGTGIEVFDRGDHGEELVHAERDVRGVFEGVEADSVVQFADRRDEIPDAFRDGIAEDVIPQVGIDGEKIQRGGGGRSEGVPLPRSRVVIAIVAERRIGRVHPLHRLIPHGHHPEDQQLPQPKRQHRRKLVHDLVEIRSRRDGRRAVPYLVPSLRGEPLGEGQAVEGQQGDVGIGVAVARFGDGGGEGAIVAVAFVGRGRGGGRDGGDYGFYGHVEFGVAGGGGHG
mmetsp:Transcript_31644/g.65203  ORF Transcript_31644/g.65203 Transcript_31644/m.65203 type:complete len:498 (-) Transcript_31644:396-1889(-)